MWNAQFFINSLLLGVGLTMDAFSVSIVAGLNEPRMRTCKSLSIAGTFAFFQALMPMIGWICIHFLVQKFSFFQSYIPWIAFALLAFIGGKMIFENLSKREDQSQVNILTIGAILIQGIATSIDALSVGFTIADYGLANAIVASLIIAAVTFLTCRIGIFLGAKMGNLMGGKAEIVGGIILIAIGIEILLTGIL